MDLELHQLDLRYEKLRRRNVAKERRLAASLSTMGQLFPVVVVRAESEHPYVLLDGYKRVRVLKNLRQDIVQATAWDLAELDALLLERLMRAGEVNSALEQGWLLEELNERFALSHEELGRRFDKSQSWVSRRLALVRALPREVQERVQLGALPAHAAMKYLVPMARAKRTDCVRLIAALGKEQPSTRELGALYATWAAGNKKTRELVVTQPSIVLRAREQARLGELQDKTLGRKLLDDFSILIGTSRRARQRLIRGALAHLLPSERQETEAAASQARWECSALFRSAKELLEAPRNQPTPPAAAADLRTLATPPQEPTHAG